MTKKKAEKKDAGAGPDTIDALFQLPPGEFTAARNALASRLKKSGHATKAEHVKALQRPPISAWTVNQLYWQHRAAFDRLLDAGQRFRTAQTAQLSGRSTDLRGPLEARRKALADLSRQAADVLREAGHPPSPDVMRRITTTLEALATYGGLPDTPEAGRLADDVDPPGFETLAALVPRVAGDGAAGGPSKVLPFQQQARKKKKATHRNLDAKDAARVREEERRAEAAAAKAALQASERALREARKQAEQAEAALKKAAARAKETEKEAREIEKEKTAVDRRYEKAASDADAARQEARRIAEQAEAAAQALEDAEEAVEQAQRALASLD